jgi:hypothetical protein
MAKLADGDGIVPEEIWDSVVAVEVGGNGDAEVGVGGIHEDNRKLSGT